MPRSAVALAALVALMVGACGDEEAGSGAAPCPTPTSVRGSEALPENLELDRFGVVTRVEEANRSVGAEIISESSVVELYPPLARDLLDSGYDILSGDNEGFEAEIFFARKGVNGAYRLREGPCKGQVTIRVVFAVRRGATRGG